MGRPRESVAFAELLAETFPTAEERAAHEREVAKLVAFAELLIALDEVREGSQLSKAELARRIGVKPSVISRLLDGKAETCSWIPLPTLPTPWTSTSRCACAPSPSASRLGTLRSRSSPPDSRSTAPCHPRHCPCQQTLTS